MHIKFNNEIIELSDNNATLKDLLSERGISENGTALALNGRLAPRNRWDIIKLTDNDEVIVITAAFGG